MAHQFLSDTNQRSRGGSPEILGHGSNLNTTARYSKRTDEQLGLMPDDSRSQWVTTKLLT